MIFDFFGLSVSQVYNCWLVSVYSISTWSSFTYIFQGQEQATPVPEITVTDEEAAIVSQSIDMPATSPAIPSLNIAPDESSFFFIH